MHKKQSTPVSLEEEPCLIQISDELRKTGQWCWTWHQQHLEKREKAERRNVLARDYICRED